LDEAVGMGLVINCDSRSQIRRLAERHRPREVSIRWNPGEGAGETEHTITAGRHVKFGTAEEKTVDAFLYAMEMGLDPAMLHQHIGSNWKGSDVRVFLGTVDRTLGMAGRVIKAAKKNGLKEVDFGGGPGIRYHYREPSFDVDAYARGICGKLEGSGLGIDAIAIEPGRYIFGDAGILLSEVNTVEVPPWKGVPVVGDNTGFNHLVRPQMYGSYHHVVVCSKADRRAGRKWMIAGNLCESGDVRTGDKHRLRPLPTPEEGDVLAALNYGAYGFSMASEYNSRNLPAEVLVLGGKDYLIRERGAFVDLLRNQRGLPRLG
jgi:diaminopimelate decarboxylase